MASEQPMLDALLAATHLAVPDAIPGLVQSFGERIGASSAVLFLVDLEQRRLNPLQPPGDQTVEHVLIEGTVAGRCYRALAVIEVPTDSGGTIVWIPVVDGTERLGVLQLLFEGPAAGEAAMKAFSGLLAELVMTKGAYGDFFEFARREEPLTIAAELLWQLLPPLTFGTDALVIAAGLVPTACLGGDAFDYGVSHDTAQVAIFDALGHDLRAGLLATTAVAAFRNARRSSFDLDATAAHIGTAISDNFDDSAFVTGIVSSLDVHSGMFAWSCAGHPAPLLVRQGRVVKHLDAGTGQPFGVGAPSDVLHEQLEPADRVLLYTDGVTEARDAAGAFFQLGKLIDLVSRSEESHPPPESMRLLMHAIEAHNDGPMRDDATVVMIEWRGPGSTALEV